MARKKRLTPEEKRMILTSFIVMIPSFVLALLALAWAPYTIFKVIIIIQVFYQFILLERFISDYYKRSLLF